MLNVSWQDLDSFFIDLLMNEWQHNKFFVAHSYSQHGKSCSILIFPDNCLRRQISFKHPTDEDTEMQRYQVM